MKLIIRGRHWLRGYVKFQSTGGSPEGFLNSCNAKQVDVWGTICKSRLLRGYISVRDYKKIRPVARENGIRLRHIEKAGLPFWTQRYRYRWGIPVGAAAFLGLLWFLSLFIWNIELSAPLPADEQLIRSSLARVGLYEGALRSGIDAQQVRLKLQMEVPEISWASVNMQGSFAGVELHQTAFPPEFVDNEEPCNLKAARDGRIVKVEATAGQIVVKPGEGVTKGDLLVSGVVENQTGTTTLVHAAGNVIAETSRQLTVEVPLQGKEKKPSGDPIVHRTLSFFELHLPLYLSNVSGEYEREWRRDYVSFLGVRLPIYVTTATFQPIREEAFSLDQQQAEEKAQKLLEEKEKSAFQNMQVKRKEIEIVRKNNKIIITGRYLCEESIALCEKIDKIS